MNPHEIKAALSPFGNGDASGQRPAFMGPDAIEVLRPPHAIAEPQHGIELPTPPLSEPGGIGLFPNFAASPSVRPTEIARWATQS